MELIQGLLSNLDEVVFDSDSSQYLDLVKPIKGTLTNLRPKHLSEDHSLTIDVIKNVANSLNLSSND